MIQSPDLSNQHLATDCALTDPKLSSPFFGNEHFQRANISLNEIYDIPIQMTESFEVSPHILSRHPFSSQAEIELYSPPNSQESASTQGSFQHQKLAKKIKKLPSLVLNSCPNSPSEQKLKLEKSKKTPTSSIKSIKQASQKKVVEQQHKPPFAGLFSEQIQRISSGKVQRTHSMDIEDNIDHENSMRNLFPSTPQNHNHHHHPLNSLRQQKESLFKKVSKFSLSNRGNHEEDDEGQQDNRINQQLDDIQDQNTSEGTIRKNKQQQRLFKHLDNSQSPIMKNDMNHNNNYVKFFRDSLAATPYPQDCQKAIYQLFDVWVRQSILEQQQRDRKNEQQHKIQQKNMFGKLTQSQGIKIAADKDAEKLKKQRFNQAQMVGGKPCFVQQQHCPSDNKNNLSSRNITELRNNSNQQNGFPFQQPSMQMKSLDGDLQQQQLPKPSQARLLFPETPTTPMKQQQQQQQIQLNTCPSTGISSPSDAQLSPNYSHIHNQQYSIQFSNHIMANQPIDPSNCYPQVSPSTPLISAHYSSPAENLYQFPLQQSILFPECQSFQNENDNFCGSTPFSTYQYQQPILQSSAEPTPSYMRQLFGTESDTNYDINLDQVISSLNLNSSPLPKQNHMNNQFNFLDQIHLDVSDGKDLSDEKLFEVIGEIKE